MYLAIDIGGSKTLVALFSTSGRLLESKRFATPKAYADFLKELKETYNGLQHDTSKIIACGVGAPGRIDRSKGIIAVMANLPWENASLRKDVEKLCDAPVAIENDANLAGLSEAKLIQKSYHKVLYLTVSTGIGGALVVDGVIEPSLADMEVGHMKFVHDGKLQAWEDFASGRYIYKKYGKKASELEDTAAWYVISRNLALGLTNAIVTLTPDVIVFGGGVGAHFNKFADPLHEELMIYQSKLITLPALRKAIRAEEAVIYGAYELARQIKK
jgi:glucokinase